jgi:TetR/AcrR family transcriptional regulator, transcriptional repressor for nem operon
VSDHHPTKERILEAAAGLMLEKSFHSVGLNEILAVVQMPKGSFYHHFESKEQFGVELLRHSAERSLEYRRKLLASPTAEADPFQRLMTYLESIVAQVLANEGKCPCLIIKLASEVVDFSPPMREALAAGQRRWIGLLQSVIEEGIARGTIARRFCPAEMAVIMQDLWCGAMQRSAIDRSATPLREAITFLRSLLTP